jgi:hypothetical protein
MASLCPIRIPAAPHGRGIVLGQARPGKAAQKRGRRADPDVEIAVGTFSDEAVRGLLEDWLVPAVVDSLIRDLMTSTVEEGR